MKDFYRPQHSFMAADQLDRVDDQPYDLVFLTIGGNDIDFGAIVEDCLLSAPFAGSQCKKSFDRSLGALDKESDFRPGYGKETFRQALAGLLKDIGVELHPGARIIYLGYPSLVGRKDPSFCADFGCTVDAYDFEDAARRLNARQASAVADANEALGGRVEVVPVLNVGSVISGNEPYMGALSHEGADLWDFALSGSARKCRAADVRRLP